MRLNELKVTEYLEKIQKREISVEQVVLQVYHQIDQIDQKIKAFLTLNRENAIQEAKRLDERLKNHEPVPHLAGLPVAVKDIICTKDIETTCGSKILKNFIPPYDATVIQRIKNAGAILIGKTNMDEFGMGSSNENSAFQTTLNPWDLTRVPGGSSGGSAASVAADEAIAALGTDTGGSIRIPASFCGIVGMKPTYGRVSRYGLIAYASSLDQIGTLTKSVPDSAIIMNILCGYDPMDSTSASIPVPDFLASCRPGIKDLNFAVPAEFFEQGIDSEVKNAVKKAIQVIMDLGGKVEEISLPHIEYALSAYYLIAMAEASSNLAKFDGVQYGLRIDEQDNLEEMYRKTRTMGFGPEVIRRIMLGTYALSSGYYDAYYLKAQKVRTLIKEDFDMAFQKYDLLLCPTSPVPPFRVGERVQDPLTMYLSDVYTVPVNLAGLPALSMNCGFTE
ncbi:MAG: Asp-tRNA(Asn)/Glu-tRNA(Gln) amidotransferase subunit GatA, partial [Candidatus Aminicenantes bacterium]|nr:Asp-tRNA(Asn)/Glu-tRNA(Gln) amidotransferase subunit GatA [Candidatus Aminicenantes bacterium]